ncbi:MAG: hypothetical protein JW731_14825 [Bacteroidales bacterium]|nr:hypothetical protein [Bacteroidales bacterium]
MNPRIGNRSQYNKSEPRQMPAAVHYVEINTKNNITLKQEYLYLEDVKTAMNIHHLETSIKMKRWMIQLLNRNAEKELIIKKLEESADNDRHMLQKKFHITI